MPLENRALERRKLRAPVRCGNGVRGVVSEETWRDASGVVVKYNLAFINHGLCSKDNGRVLGYDNAHGIHERHWMGEREPFPFTDFAALAEHFTSEVAELRKRKQ